MKKRGIGYASTFYGTGYGNGFPDISRAIAELGKDGNVYIYVGATEVGQGAKTILSQIAAEALGIDFSKITFICEDTSITPDAGTAAASRQTYNTGNAIKLAAEELKREIMNVASEELNVNTTNIQEYLKKIADIKGDKVIRKDGIFTASTTEMDVETGQGNPYYPYTFSVYGVEVEVDTSTGIVEVLRAACGQDVGRAINPKLIEGQIDGGFSMGLGYAIMEDLNVENGKIKHDRFTSYLIPTALDMPDIDKIIVEDPESTGPYGAKGIGEPVLIAVAPAILNAIYNAVGVRMTEVPVTPEKLLKALREKERGA
ncbi:xanthine dehydrogenase family protein molybdopterin-binding subunit [Alkaliphilus peptidifermentans]|uniref:Purine hydroxylase beta subunit apoprotein n=1 Tax=Alkaliphilus peptidifermentans DSM 18978 TaxID=1120976 RepID=A0A1G5KW26_9FIRM|nr:molybdopterin cofactor-binding domain-containing protein [Alkaliphilus peptidifermentans]SCZ04797.1 purine hydroxylase beta subunit apoprotein [Alkaliphilus peptidifermentans DSM 18978]